MRKHVVVVVVVVVDDDYKCPRCFRVRHAGTYDSDLTITINLHCIASGTYDPSTPIHIYPVFFSMFSSRLEKVRAVLIGERELREVWERFPNMWFCASCCFSCNALGENLHISRFAPELCLPECAAACTIATDGLSTRRAQVHNGRLGRENQGTIS